jgi:hypothetical protein
MARKWRSPLERSAPQNARWAHALDLTAAWRQAQLAELLWDDGPSAGPDAIIVVPLTESGTLCVALPYDQHTRADRLSAAGTAVVTIANRALARGAPTLTARVRVRRSDDLTGEVFEGSTLLLQELAKHPPSRRRLDSILLRREHWWYLPRIVLHLEPTEDPQPLPATDTVLAHVASEGLTVAAVRIATHGAREITVAPIPAAGTTAPAGRPNGPAVLLQHGAEPPDLERRWLHRWYGTVDGARLAVDRLETWGRADRSPGLRQRIRDEWALERGCRAGLRAAGGLT